MSLDLRERLRERRPEIEQTILTRVYAVDDPTEVGDGEYVMGLRAAVSAALTYGLGAIEGRARAEPVPQELLSQARRAARSGVSLDTVLRRYFAGYTLLDDFIAQEAESAGGGRALGQRALRTEAVLLDRLIDAVAKAHADELRSRNRSAESRRSERVKHLLDGELVDVPGLGYGLEGWHSALIARRPEAQAAIRAAAATLGRRLLVVRPGGEELWVWMGGPQMLRAEELQSLLSPAHGPLAIGEPGYGICGWRISHRQAKAAFPLATREGECCITYSQVALVASVWADDLLAESLRKRYLVPLEDERDGGMALRETLRAYFAVGRNAASAAATLGVSRQTVSTRLQAVEQKIGCTLGRYGSEVEVALRLSDLAFK